ncbi:Kinesin-3 [Wickerhamomyces ciferrii]|uniref:Kinesin-3 n=1 Tax=Wickerhamomyces ciferrii (strain ATCC 14091 / BCRC 22168 / CBS 111 / JCM 3599 / NBRC 0793 / NRRL Y-1031 F-60-10) TaxID=1206466 RepID=K0KI84_WICCF|nr:Kinesin-3 [Wickerhamomyces ciferrii]CCH41114.1 Kinesin-3 [Wickerhamomyces ciferrii]
MSNIPLSNKNLSGSPPIKNRKAFNNITKEVNNSPKYSNHTNIERNSSKRTSMRLGTLRKTSIPTNINAETMSKMKSLSQAGMNFEASKRTNIKSSRQSNIFDSSSALSGSLNDPLSIRRQQEALEKNERHANSLRGQIEEKSRQIQEINEIIKDLTRSRNSLVRHAIDIKSKIDDAEISIINIDHKIEALERSVQKDILHEEQMNTIRIKEQQNILIRELDEFKAILEEQLQHAHSYRDDESKAEIAKLEEESVQLSNTLNSLNEGTQDRLRKEKEVLDKELEKILAAEEARCEDITKAFEEKSVKLQSSQEILNDLNSKLSNVKSKKQDLIERIDEQTKIQENYNDKFSELEKQLRELKLKHDIVDEELAGVTEVHDLATASYNESYNKIDKESKLRRRIQNTIQDLNNKLRVYARVLPSSNDQSNFQISPACGEEKQSISTKTNSTYLFDKIFNNDFLENDICDEIVCLNENNLNGANVSVLFTGFEESLLFDELSQKTLDALIQREEKYKSKNWYFEYGFKFLSITTNGVFDLVTGKESNLKLENRTIHTDAESVKSSNLKLAETSSDASILIILTVNGTNGTKSFTSHSYSMNLSHIESSDLILHAVSKIRENKFSSSEFTESPMYQLVHFLYSNTKSLTFINLVNDENKSDENKKLLELASFVNETDAIPIKRVYNTPLQK